VFYVVTKALGIVSEKPRVVQSHKRRCISHIVWCCCAWLSLILIPVLDREKEAMARYSIHTRGKVDSHCSLASTIRLPVLALHLRRTIWTRTHCDLLTYSNITSGMPSTCHLADSLVDCWVCYDSLARRGCRVMCCGHSEAKDFLALSKRQCRVAWPKAPPGMLLAARVRSKALYTRRAVR
jgi:hypothetical protein